MTDYSLLRITKSKVFGPNVTIGVLGALTDLSLEEAENIIKATGASFSSTITKDITYALSTTHNGRIFLDQYKLQHFPELEAQAELALMYSIPILSFDWIVAVAKKKQALPTQPYILSDFLVDFESKYSIKHDQPSKLHPAVQELMKTFFNQKALDGSISSLGLDVKRMKLITADSINTGFGILKELEANITEDPQFTKEEHEARLRAISNKFYAVIPHTGDAQFIKSAEAIKEKASLLSALVDIEIAQRLMGQSMDGELNMNPLDMNYRKLRTTIEPLESYRQEYKIIQDVVANTQTEHFPYKLSLAAAFEISRDGEADRFAPFKDLPHHRLLWHGSRTTNFIGILSQGLRVAPPEAPVSGYFLGKGIYLADMCSVSAQYCKATRENPYGYLLLVDSALGKTYHVAHGKYFSKADLDEAGFNSVKCWGQKGPDQAFDIDMDGLIVSTGKEGPTQIPTSELIHNEIVVYGPEQTLCRYLVKVKFEFDEE